MAKLIVETCARETDILIFSGFSLKREKLIVLLSEIVDGDATLHTYIYI